MDQRVPDQPQIGDHQPTRVSRVALAVLYMVYVVQDPLPASEIFVSENKSLKSCHRSCVPRTHNCGTSNLTSLSSQSRVNWGCCLASTWLIFFNIFREILILFSGLLCPLVTRQPLTVLLWRIFLHSVVFNRIFLLYRILLLIFSKRKLLINEHSSIIYCRTEVRKYILLIFRNIFKLMLHLPK